MISAWDVYWVMQLDSICALFFLVGLGALLVAGWLAGPATDFEGGEKVKKLRQAATRWSVVAFVAFGASAFVPSSKTAAAMIVLPALTSEQIVAPVSAEASELYALAKQALRNIAEKGEAQPEKSK